MAVWRFGGGKFAKAKFSPARGIPRSLLPAGLLLWGCASPVKPDGPDPSFGAVEVRALLESAPQEGDLGRFKIEIRNGSRSYVVLLDLGLRDARSPLLAWQVRRPGTAAYDLASDAFRYDPKGKGATAPLFNLGLLAPGEEVSFLTRVRLLHLPQTLRLRFFEYGIDEVARRIYFGKKDPDGLRYGRLIGSELRERLRTSAAAGKTSHRRVLFPYAHQVAVRPRELTAVLDTALERRPFSLEAAKAKAGVETAETVSYYATLNLWALQTGSRAWLVGPTRLLPLPRIRDLPGLLHLLDAADHATIEVEFRKETKTLFSDRYRLIYDRAGKRYVAFVPRREVLAFFQAVRDHRLTLEAERTVGGGGRIVVTK